MTYLRQILTSGDYEQSSGNTSTTPLGSGSTFTGTGELNGWSDVMVVCKTDNTGTIFFDFSPDGTNWDSTFPPLGFAVSDGISEFHTAVKGPRYFRVRLVNDTGAQSYLRLYTYYGHFGQGNLPLNATIGQDADAIIVRPTNPTYEVALGRVSDSRIWNKWGYNSDVDSAAVETIWSFGGSFIPLTSAETMDVVSGSGNDTLAGTGAQQVIIEGVDGNWEYAFEIVDMNGVTPVTTTATFLGINRVAIYLAGSGRVNAGDIDITATTAATNQAQIPTGEGTTQQAIFFVQENHTALIDWLHINIIKTSGGSSPEVAIKAWVYSDVSNAFYEVFRENVDVGIENQVTLNPSQPFIVSEKSIFYLTADSDTNDTAVSARFSLEEVKNI